MRKDVAVVIATYNEADSIGELLDKLTDYDVIVVDDNSPDGTAEVVKQHAHEDYIVEHPTIHLLVRHNQRGIASAYMDGFKVALKGDYKYIVQMDAGFTHDPDDIPGMIDLAFHGADLVIGSRFIRPYTKLGYRTFISLHASKSMNSLWNNHPVIKDVTSGFRVWRASELSRLLNNRVIRAQGFAFQVEVLFKVMVDGASVREYPIKYKLTNSSFNWKMLIEGLKTYWQCWRRSK